MKFNATINWCGHTIEREIEAKSKEDADRILESQIVSETEITIEAKPENLPTVKVEKFGEYRTRQGLAAWVLSYTKDRDWPYRGCVQGSTGGWNESSWTYEGLTWGGNSTDDNDLVEFIREIEFPPIDSPVEVKPKDVIDGPGLYEDIKGDAYSFTLSDKVGNWLGRRVKDDHGGWFKADGTSLFSRRSCSPITRKLIDFNTMEVLSHDT